MDQHLTGQGRVEDSETARSLPSLLKEAMNYFDRPPYRNYFHSWIGKYRSLGRLGGKITLPTLTSEEEKALAAFLRRPCPPPLNCTFKELETAWNKSKFGLVPLLRFLDNYRGEEHGPIKTKIEERQILNKEKEDFFNFLLQSFPHPLCQHWLKGLKDKDPAALGPVRSLPLDKDLYGSVLRAITHLPGQWENLAIFSARICGNAHALDSDRPQGRLFFQALRYLKGDQDQSKENGKQSLENYHKIIGDFFLFKEDLLNFASFSGLRSEPILPESEQEAEVLRKFWNFANDKGITFNWPLHEIHRFSPFYPHHGDQVFVVENPSVFSKLKGHFQGQCLPLISLNGQTKQAAWALLSSLADSGIKIYYSGDFDPEGLQIAQSLADRFPQNLIHWRFSPDDYRKTAPQIKLTSKRLKILRLIKHPSLIPTAQMMDLEKKAGHQEAIIDELIQDLSQIF